MKNWNLITGTASRPGFVAPTLAGIGVDRTRAHDSQVNVPSAGFAGTYMGSPTWSPPIT